MVPNPVSPQEVELGSERVLVSACLAGRACRYDGSSNRVDWVTRLMTSGRAVLACPEVDGGLGTPRPPAEIVGGSGEEVLDGRARVITRDGRDVTEAYVRGAERALEAARRADVRIAVLKARSPSCGGNRVYDGTFTRTLTDGEGVTAALLRRHGITVLTEEDLEAG